MDETKRLIEAALFLSQEPVSANELSEKLGIEREEVEKALEELVKEYSERGIIIKKVAGGFRFYTSPDLSERLKKFVEDRPVKLSRNLLEVLAIVAYNQPVTKKEIWLIRGHNPDGALRSLEEKGLVEVVGRANSPGKPKLYGVTKLFLSQFGLNSLDELPKISIEDIDE